MEGGGGGEGCWIMDSDSECMCVNPCVGMLGNVLDVYSPIHLC